MLSEENKQKIVFSGLYKSDPDPQKHRDRISDYHCRNWTFRPHEYDGKVFMTDTYFGDGNTYLVTDDNIDKFEFVFDFNRVKRISDYEYDEYDECDIYRIATDSGGYSCGHLYWVNKDAKRSKDKLMQKQINEIDTLKRKLQCAEEELIKLENGTHYKLK